jgi:hypothetical protein
MSSHYLKPIIIVTPVENGYILVAVHPDTSMEVGQRVATMGSTYDSNSLHSGIEKLMEIQCVAPESLSQAELFVVTGSQQSVD